MKLALISQEYPPQTAKGGLGSQTYLKARGLAELGHKVHVISRSQTGHREEYWEGQVKVTRIPGFSTRLSVHEPVVDWLTYSAEVAVEIEALHRQTPLDLIDFPEWGCEGYIHLLNQCEWNRVPAVIQLHGPLVMLAHQIHWPELDSEFYRVGTAMEGTCLRLANAVFSSSHCSAEWCANHYHLKREEIPTLHTGVDIDWFSPRGVPKAARPTILFAGKLARNKGVHLLVEAACQLAREFADLQLRLLGRGEQKIVEELLSMAIHQGFPRLLDMPGFVDRQSLPDHLSRAHVFAAPSCYEGGPGFVYLEAMACGLPVIACEGSGAAEVVHPGENGFLVAPGNLEVLVEALRSLLGNDSMRERMGMRARRFVEEHADSKVCVKRLESFYTRAAAGK